MQGDKLISCKIILSCIDSLSLCDSCWQGVILHVIFTQCGFVTLCKQIVTMSIDVIHNNLYWFILIMWQLVTRCEFKCHIPPPPQPSTAHLPDHTAVFSSGRDRLQFSNHFFYSIITNIANGKYRTKSKTLVLHKIIRKFAQNKQENKQANRQTNKQTENSITEATIIPCGSSGGAGQQRFQIQKPLLSPVDRRGERANKW